MNKKPTFDASCWTLPDYIEWSRDQIFTQHAALVNLQTRLENRIRIQEENSMLARGERKELYDKIEQQQRAIDASQELLTRLAESLGISQTKIRIIKSVMDHYADIAPRFSDVLEEVRENLKDDQAN